MSRVIVPRGEKNTPPPEPAPLVHPLMVLATAVALAVPVGLLADWQLAVETFGLVLGTLSGTRRITRRK